jgi:hypothetical protein
MNESSAASDHDDRETNDLMALAYEQAMEDAKHSVSPCFVNCGAPACLKLGCVRVYNDLHRDDRSATTAS